MIWSNAAAARLMPRPVRVAGVEKPNPGSDGMTTWNASSASTAVRLGVDERPDHPDELHEGARVAVGHQQRRRVRNGGAHVDEVVQLAIDGGRELRELVQAVLVGRPVEAVRPAIGEPTGV